ncbi:hypothetical protein BFAG_01017 [Bacteroides fragilis 3_1_12]|uniref:Uncharacterized protein n=1 Tax=Bacteroides fragilis 3_1_12 TaxID=457424 RepID=A0ABN0BHE1_BACFG|nr:hypothetical protein BFAG_01017 [Bacteroides fragilis 3_1_12]
MYPKNYRYKIWCKNRHNFNNTKEFYMFFRRFVSVFFHSNSCLLKNRPEKPFIILNNIHYIF